MTPESNASAADHETLPERSMVAEFEILGIIGEGGFGTVYLAMDHSLDRKVALKEYRPAALATRTGTTVVLRSQRHAEAFAAGLKSFINEARTLARFDHPALVRVYRFWQDNGTAYMAMPLYSGQTLTQYVREGRDQVDQAWLTQLLVPLLDAVEALHGAQIYHRDIAPDNVLIRENGMPILLDFGAAREIVTDMTQALTVILKPGYAPVEQYAEDKSMKQGPWTDIYALGAVAYFAVTGRAPTNSVTRLVNDTLAPLASTLPSGYAPEFLGAIDRSLAVRPHDRPQSIADLRALFGFPRRQQSVRPPIPSPDVAQPGAAAHAETPSAVDAHATIPAPPAREPSPTTAAPQSSSAPVATTPERVAARAESVTIKPEPVAARPEPVAARPEPVVAGAEPVLTRPEAVEAIVAKPRRRTAWPWIGAGAVAVLVAGVAFRALMPSPSATGDTRPAVQPSTNQAPAGSTDAAGTLPAASGAQSAGQPSGGTPDGTQSAPVAAKNPQTVPAGSSAAPTNADAANPVAVDASGARAAQAPAILGQGIVRLDVKPWASVRVDGEEKGVSPPLKSLKLAIGKHVIELTNSNFPPYTTEIEVEKDRRVALSYEFK